MHPHRRVVHARTGAALDRGTVTTDPDGHAELVALAEAHSGLRAWAMEGTGGYGAASGLPNEA